MLITPLFMALMNVSNVNVSLPAIEHSLEASSGQIQWVLAGYALTFGLVLVPCGRLGDLFGRRTIFLVGVAGFAIASLGAALAWSPLSLNGWRMVQGLAAGVFNPQIIGLVQQHFRGPMRARAYGVMGAFIGVAMAVGPLLGGVTIAILGEDPGWRWVFGINVPVGVLALVLAWRWLPRDRRGRDAGGPRPDLDPLGVALFGVAMVLVMLPFLSVTDGWWIWLALPLGAGVAWVWFGWEERYSRGGKAPMVAPGLLRHRGFRNGSMLIFFYFMALAPSWVLLTQYVQVGLGRSALVAGLACLPAALAGAACSVFSGRVVGRWGRPLVAWGVVIALLGQMAFAAVAWLSPDSGPPVWAVALAFMASGAGQGLVIGPNQTLTLEEVPIQHGGAAGGVMQTGQRLGSAMGFAIGTGVLFAVVGGTNWSTGVLVTSAVLMTTTTIALVLAVLDARRRAGTA